MQLFSSLQMKPGSQLLYLLSQSATKNMPLQEDLLTLLRYELHQQLVTLTTNQTYLIICTTDMFR